MAGTRPTIYLYTDGAASGNPGPGGWGAVLCCGGFRKELSGGYARTTNNRMELLAVIEGLSAIKWEHADVVVTSDSSYVVKAFTEGWLESWKRKGFRKVKNTDLWFRLIPLVERHNVSFRWVQGHAGHPENERCDTLAVEARSLPAGALPADEGFEEGESDGQTLL